MELSDTIGDKLIYIGRPMVFAPVIGQAFSYILCVPALKC
jgi:hypothetical protein